MARKLTTWTGCDGDSKICGTEFQDCRVHGASGGEGLQAANKQGSKVSATEPLPVAGTIVFQLRLHVCRNV